MERRVARARCTRNRLDSSTWHVKLPYGVLLNPTKGRQEDRAILISDHWRPPNDLRLSGEADGVRCSRGLDGKGSDQNGFSTGAGSFRIVEKSHDDLREVASSLG